MGAGVDLAGTGDPELLVVHQFQPLSRPAGGPSYGEHHGECARRDTHRLVDDPRPVVDVRVELAAGEVLVVEGSLLELYSDIEQRALFIRRLQDLVHVAADYSGPRIVVLVDPVSEAHQAFLTLLYALEEVGDIVRRTYPLEHLEDRHVRSAVRGSVEPGDAGGDGGEGVVDGAPHHPHRRRRAVLLVVGVEYKEHVQGLLYPGVGLVAGLGHLEEHREEVPRVGEFVVRVDVGEPEAVAVGEGGKGGHLRDQTHRRDVTLEFVVHVPGFRVEGRERAYRREQHARRVRVVTETVHEVLDVLVDVGVVGDLVDPVVELLLVGQVSVEEQVGDLQKAGVLGELFDGDAPVLKDAILAVDVGDIAPATRRIGEAGIVGHEAEVVIIDLYLAEVHRPYGAIRDLDVVALARAVVRHRQAIVARGLTFLHRLCLLGQTLAPFVALALGRRQAAGLPFPELFPLHYIAHGRTKGCKFSAA